MELIKGTLSYKALLDSLALRRGNRGNLDLIKFLDRELCHPSRAFRSIHVAGTNGKGSVTTKIAQALTTLGYKTGLYTSPHISSFRERIQIDGKWISEERMQDLLHTVLNLSDEVSFFEAITMVAFLYFMQEKVDYAVIETGLGGIFDATNIVQPQVSIITSLSLDHEDVLGNGIEKIAENKAGIIKYKTPTVLAESAALRPIFNKAFEMQAPLYFLPKIEDWMEENRLLAKKGLSILFPNVDEFVVDALPPCRFEIIPMQDVTLLFDVAHNEDGIGKLFWRLERIFPHREISLIFGMSRSKDIATIASFLKERVKSVYLDRSEHPRLLPSDEMRAYFPEAEDDFEIFLEKAKRNGHLVVITGSFFIMKEWKEHFGFIGSVDPLVLVD